MYLSRIKRKKLPEAIDLTQIGNTDLQHNHVMSQPHLFNLPDDLLILIFRKLKHPLHQIAFLLSCKKTAALFSGIPLNRILTTRRCWNGRVSVAYAHRHLVLDMAKWRGFIPKKTQFCHICERFLPRDRVWRQRRIRIADMKRVDWMWTISLWRGGGKICPACQVSDLEKEEWLQPWPESFGRRPLIRQPLPKNK